MILLPETVLSIWIPKQGSVPQGILIPLSQGKFSLIDKEDFERVSKYKWTYDSFNDCAFRSVLVNHKKTVILLHRFILNAPIALQVDHINHSRLDNRKINLRLCTNAENSRNCNKKSTNTTGFKGVSFKQRSERGKQWEARIKVNYQGIYLGMFKTKEEAAIAYNEAARKYFGKFARLNTL